MDSLLFNHLLIPFLISIFLAINMGGSGTGPSFSAAYGANVIRRSLIPGLFGIMVFIGAIVAGKNTATTIGQDIIPKELMSFTVVSIVLFSVAIALLVANLSGIPQSTSQATVLAIVAVGIYFHSFDSRRLTTEIIPTWFVLPVIAFISSFLIGKYIYHPLRRKGYTTSGNLTNHPAMNLITVVVSLYVAFSIGSNNVANASGPISSMTINELGINENQKNFVLIMIISTLVVAPSFGIGSSIFGHKILEKTGKDIVQFGKIEAIIISFVSGSLLLSASLVKGIPTSLVQLNVGCILGIGVSKLGFRRIFRRTEVNKFFAMWIISPAIAFSLCLLLTFAADKFGIITMF